jgi:acyl carrier protein
MNKSNDSISYIVIDLISSVACEDKDDINEDTDIFKDLTLDSMDIKELILEFEEAFDIDIDDIDIINVSTVGEIIEYINNEIKNKTKKVNDDD